MREPGVIEQQAAVRALYRAAGAAREQLERCVLTEHELTWAGWALLATLDRDGGLELWEAAARLGLAKSTLARTVAVLRERGLIRRSACPGDGRRVLLALTPDGQRLAAELAPAIDRHGSRALACLSADEQELIGGVLARLVRHLSAVRPPG